MPHLKFVFLSLVILSGLQRIRSIEYEVKNKAASTTGGMRFTNEIGHEYCLQTMKSATELIWKILRQDTSTERKYVQKVSLLVESMGRVAYTSNSEIHLSAHYIGSYTGEVKREITGILYHHMTHVLQWNGNGLTPEGLIEGIADFVRSNAGYAPAQWMRPGQGDQWDQGHDVTAHFLDYCNSLNNEFVAELNRKMRTDYNANYFVELLGKTVDQLWRDYKAKYNN